MLTRRSFFGLVVAGASTLVLPRRRPRIVSVPMTIQITYSAVDFDERLQQLRKQFAEIIQWYNTHSNYVPVLPQGIERIDFVSAPYNNLPPIIRLPEYTCVVTV